VKVVKLEWRQKPKQRRAHAYRLHRHKLLGPLCNGDNEPAPLRKDQAGQLSSYNDKRCAACNSIIDRFFKFELDVEFVREEFTDVTLERQP
jgi:hypothetical protein